MNFRTTILLLALLAILGGVYFWISSKPDPAKTDKAAEHKLMDVKDADVTRLAITNADGKRTVLEKSGTEWRLVEPVKALAKTFDVDDLIRALTGLQSRGQVDASKKTSGGLDHPSYVVELTTKAGQTTKLSFGDPSKIGDSLYVLVNDNAKPDVVPGSVYTQLDKPASNYRDTRLVNVSTDKVQQLAITHGKQTIRLQKKGADWQITEPKTMPGDPSAVSDLLFGITGLNASEFLESPDAMATASLTRPRYTVWFSTEPAATQPAAGATTQPNTMPASMAGGETIRFGGYQDVTKKNVFASLNGGEVAVVPATAEKTFDKQPLDLRNKELVNLDPERVSSFTIAIDRPATTQPTTRPAEQREFTIERRKETAPILGPVLPSRVAPQSPAAPATQPSGAAPATQPAEAAPATQPAATSGSESSTPSTAATPAATQPTTNVALTQPAGAAAPATTQPADASASSAATAPAATQSASATTQPAATQPVSVVPPPPPAPPSKWFFASGGNGDAEEGQVTSLLAGFHPLRVEKYLEHNPATQPAGGRFTLTIHVIPAKAGDAAEDEVFRFTDPGDNARLIGSYKDLTFEVDRALLDKLTGDFKTKKETPAPPPSFPGGFPGVGGPGGMPFGGG